jgi:hypothetical protein
MNLIRKLQHGERSLQQSPPKNKQQFERSTTPQSPDRDMRLVGHENMRFMGRQSRSTRTVPIAFAPVVKHAVSTISKQGKRLYVEGCKAVNHFNGRNEMRDVKVSDVKSGDFICGVGTVDRVTSFPVVEANQTKTQPDVFNDNKYKAAIIIAAIKQGEIDDAYQQGAESIVSMKVGTRIISRRSSEMVKVY